jgi:hypothetical protein
MPIPRNVQARSNNYRKKYGDKMNANKKIADLDNICKKHNIGDLSFRSCKLSDGNGRVTLINHDKIRGNMKSSVLIVDATMLTPAVEDTVYDLIKIKHDKAVRDEQKKQEELEKAKLEISRIQNADTLNEADNSHLKLLEELTGLDTSTETGDFVTTTIDDKPHGKISDIAPTLNDNTPLESSDSDIPSESSDRNPILDSDVPSESSDRNPISDSDVPSESSDRNPILDSDVPSKSSNSAILNDLESIAKSEESNSTNEKRDDAINKLNSELAKKAKNEKNRFHRNFLKDLKSKFTVTMTTNYQFFEVKAEVTDMVIVNAVVYTILMPSNVEKTYLLILGDLQMKTGVIRQIDPSYQSDKTFRDHDDFLERIKAREDTKISSIPDSILDDSELVDYLDEN